VQIMTRLAFLAALAVLTTPLVASAQPAPPTGDATAPAPTDDKIREIVDREVARILNERAQKDAADRAAREQAEKDAATTTATDKYADIAGSSGFMDTRIAFTLTNENVLVKPGETIPSVPGWRFGIPSSLGVLFFDNYDTRYSGFETLSHAVMYRDYHRGHLDAEAAFVLRINELAEKSIDLSDDGTYVKISNWKDPTHKDPTRISLTAFPVSADRMRLGYSYRLSWGGNPEYGRTRAATPGVKIQYDAPKMYAFVGAKSSVILDRRTAEQKSALGFLAGAGVDPTEMVRLEVNGGYFDRGYNELVDVNDQKVQLFGASAQVAIHKGMPVQSSIDYKLYKNDNEKVSGLFAPVKYPGGTSWLAMAEATILGQTLRDPEKIGSTTVQYGHAADLNVRVMVDRVRFRFDASYRDLAFILHSVPSLPTYSDFPSAFSTTPDIFAAVGVDKNWNDYLTLGVIAGVDKPASLTSPVGAPQIPGAPTMRDSTAVFRNNNIDTIITILPAGEKVVPQFALKGTAKIDFGHIYVALLEVFYSRDPNTTRYTRSGPESPFEFTFGQFNQLGVNATLQARF
jgi:hypothetical protein